MTTHIPSTTIEQLNCAPTGAALREERVANAKHRRFLDELLAAEKRAASLRTNLTTRQEALPPQSAAWWVPSVIGAAGIGFGSLLTLAADSRAVGTLVALMGMALLVSVRAIATAAARRYQRTPPKRQWLIAAVAISAGGIAIAGGAAIGAPGQTIAIASSGLLFVTAALALTVRPLMQAMDQAQLAFDRLELERTESYISALRAQLKLRKEKQER